MIVPRIIRRCGAAPTEMSSVRLLLDEAVGTVGEGKVAGGHDGGVAESGCGEGGGHDGEADWVGQVGSPGIVHREMARLGDQVGS